MTRIAHLSDLHLLESDHHDSDTLRRLRLGFLSFGRPLDANDRRFRLGVALSQAMRGGADHIVITGDLTEDGTGAQFEAVAEVLSESRICPERITLVPGNHDAYDHGGAFARALRGPLQAFARTSAPGSVVAYRDLALVAVSTAMAQSLPRAAGRIDDAHAHELERILDDHALMSECMIFAQHHPPETGRLTHWVEGLQDPERERGWLADHEQLHVLHGHTHRREDRRVERTRTAQVFSVEAVVESAIPVRFYEPFQGQLVPVDARAPATAMPTRAPLAAA